MRWAISGGAGFLGLHLARRLLADGHEVQTLDVVPLDDPGLESSVEEIRGDVRDQADAQRLVGGAEVLVHAAARLPAQASRDGIRSVNVDGAAVTLTAALEAGVGRAILISSTAVYGVPEIHPIPEDAPLVGVGHYGESKIEAEHVAEEVGRRGLEVVILRPKTFLGPERLGVFEILFDWIREGRRIPILGDGSNRYQLLALAGLRAATLCAASSGSRLRPVPALPAELALRTLEVLRLSPLAEWHYRTAHRDSYVEVSKAQRLLGFSPRLSNAQALCGTYDWYLEHREQMRSAGVTHRVPWDQRALGLLKRLS